MKKPIVIIALFCILAGCAATDRPSPSAVVTSPEPAVKTLKNESGNLEYLRVSIAGNEEAGAIVSRSLEDFFLRFEDTDDAKKIDGKAHWALIGGRYLSVTREQVLTTENTSYPTNRMAFMTFDLETGEPVTVVRGASDLKRAFESGKFKQVYPGEIEGAQAKALEMLEGAPAYLTDEGLMLYSSGEGVHASGDYWLFLAKYADISDILLPEIAKSVK